VPPASLSTSVLKRSGSPGAAPSSAMLQAGQGIPAPPQSQPCGPSQGRRRWFSQTHPVSAHRMHFIGRRHFPDARRLKLSAQPSLDVLNRIAGDRTDRRCKARRAGTAFAPSGRGISDIGLKVINAAWRPSRGKIDRRILPLSVRERERIIFSAGMELLQSNGKQPFPRPSARRRGTHAKRPRDLHGGALFVPIEAIIWECRRPWTGHLQARSWL
jgi:hypothetical protein